MKATLQLALDALEYMNVTAEHHVDNRIPEAAITAIKEALAQPEQEPVASCNGMPAYEGPLSKSQRKQLTQDLDAPLTLNGVALYPQRTWVGLDEEDDIDWEEGGSLRDLVEAVEAKLKEKNA